MTEPPPRKRFQIHLSTAIVMMFVAGGIIWANVSRRPLNQFGQESNNFVTYGWPAPVLLYFTPNIKTEQEDSFIGITRSTIIVDAVIGINILAVVYFICEWLIRRRAARKGA